MLFFPPMLVIFSLIEFPLKCEVDVIHSVGSSNLKKKNTLFEINNDVFL